MVDPAAEAGATVHPTRGAPRVLLLIGGGIAAYKAPELVRRLRDRGIAVRCVLTRAGAHFVSPLALGAVSEDKVHTELFSLTDEAEMGHIELSRAADLLLVAPATADLLAKMAAGLADDLATTVLLATDKPVAVAPAMNVRMWHHQATQANLATLRARDVAVIGPGEGPMACGEYGLGRMSDVPELVAAVVARLADRLDRAPRPLAGRHALVTSGPTYEPIDPVRFIGNRSSGKQGHAIAQALAAAGAKVTLVTGPVALADPPELAVVHVETAQEMLAAVEAALPADIAVCAAAVADWRPEQASGQKIKKDGRGAAPPIGLVENPDILARLSAAGPRRPALVVGFAAETEHVLAHAEAKRRRKRCDWIVANDVSPATGTFGGDHTAVHLITAEGAEALPPASKRAVADDLVQRICRHLQALAARARP